MGHSDNESDVDVDELLDGVDVDELLDGSDADDDLSQHANTAKPSKKRSKMIGIISFTAAMDQLRRILDCIFCDSALDEDNVSPTRGRSSRRKKKKSLRLKSSEWDEVCLAIEKVAIADGLNVEDLDVIWNLLSNKEINVADKHSSKLLLSMIPKEDRIPQDRIHSIICQISRFKDKSKVTALKYLIGVFDYNLCDKEAFSEYDSYCRICLVGRSNAMIPWICALMKRISTSELISQGFVTDMIDLAHKATLTSPILNAVIDILRFIKNIRRDLVPMSVYGIAIGVSKQLHFDEPFQAALYRARRRFLGGEEDLLEPESISNRFHLIGMYLKKLNDQCFSDFLLHRDGDPAPDDYLALAKMSKYDQMRCALKTNESLSLIIVDQEVYECFNSFVSLILQHRFDNYVLKDELRYKFILKRICQVTALREMSIPAVTDWLLDFLRTWDGYLFKTEIYKLIPWLPPIEFADGYIHILRKFETLFLYGENDHRMQVWLTMKKLSLEWIFQLQQGTDGNSRTIDSIKNAVWLLLVFMDSILGRLCSVKGHIDAEFLQACCETYTQLNHSISLVRTQPFYVFPPRHLWVMVVLSNSLGVMESFCAFLNRATPRRSLAHLKHTPQQEKYRKWNEEILQDVARYFTAPQESDVPVFVSVFTNEWDGLEDAEDSVPTDVFSDLEEKIRTTVTRLHEDLREFTAFTSNAFSKILLDANLRGNSFVTSIDEKKAGTLCPNILNWIIQPGNVTKNVKQKRSTAQVVRGGPNK